MRQGVLLAVMISGCAIPHFTAPFATDPSPTIEAAVVPRDGELFSNVDGLRPVFHCGENNFEIETIGGKYRQTNFEGSQGELSLELKYRVSFSASQTRGFDRCLSLAAFASVAVLGHPKVPDGRTGDFVEPDGSKVWWNGPQGHCPPRTRCSADVSIFYIARYPTRVSPGEQSREQELRLRIELHSADDDSPPTYTAITEFWRRDGKLGSKTTLKPISPELPSS